MIPYLLAVLGGYLLGDSMKDSQTFSDGGKTQQIKIGDLVSFDEYESYSLLNQDRGLPKKIKIFGEVVGISQWAGNVLVEVDLDEDERYRLDLKKIEDKRISDLTLISKQ
jgi:hypothetical protein